MGYSWTKIGMGERVRGILGFHGFNKVLGGWQLKNKINRINQMKKKKEIHRPLDTHGIETNFRKHWTLKKLNEKYLVWKIFGLKNTWSRWIDDPTFVLVHIFY